jgi:hypothetical protein
MLPFQLEANFNAHKPNSTEATKVGEGFRT